jgi:DNA-binding MarR family transcriptional regulator
LSNSNEHDDVDVMIADWRRERPGLDFSALALTTRLLRLGRHFERAHDEALGGLGLKPGWLDVLSALRRSGSPYSLTPGRLATESMLSSAAMTNRLDRLEEAGMVRRSPDPNDRRGIQVQLTDQGRELVDTVLDAHLGLVRRLLKPLQASERDDLDALLRELLGPLDRGEAPTRASLYPTGRVSPRRRRT